MCEKDISFDNTTVRDKSDDDEEKKADDSDSEIHDGEKKASDIKGNIVLHIHSI